ncbi:helix-turn-helix domain-containing protein [Rhodobacteraceae bacterium DSL-40]|uniref:helix-turn-helix domain-containing protein n=1 Tax=Amaricoccus sp. B4 TaxID=3368557 RepID=UPI0013A6DFD3
MKRRYSQLSLDNRRRIERLRHAQVSADEIARRLGRHRSTIFRELVRNRHHDAEIPELTACRVVLAQKLTAGRRFRLGKLVRHLVCPLKSCPP